LQGYAAYWIYLLDKDKATQKVGHSITDSTIHFNDDKIDHYVDPDSGEDDYSDDVKEVNYYKLWVRIENRCRIFGRKISAKS
jgi:hypothetical protein